MENPFITDWDGLKSWHLKRDRRHIAACIGIAAILLPLPTAFFAHFSYEARIIANALIFGICLLLCVSALSLFNAMRSFKREVISQAPVQRYEELLELCRTFPQNGEQCRVAAADLLSRQGYLTEWQVEILLEELKKLGAKERLETLKGAFLTEIACTKVRV